MNYLLGVILFGVVVVFITSALDFINNRKNSGEAALLNTMVNLLLALLISFGIFAFTGLGNSGAYLLKVLNP
jgi:hypothetical protein